MGKHPDILSLLPETDFSRRGFVVGGALTAGFALSVQPVSAAAITTDSKGLKAGEISIPTADGNIPGYMARPEGNGTYPVTLVVQEIFGVHAHIQDICRRFAKLGHMAIAPSLYHRQGDPTQYKNFREIIKNIVPKVPDAQVMSDLDAAVKWASASGNGDTSKLGITGFCWGGRIVWLYAAHNPNLKAGVAWYGRIQPRSGGSRTANQPKYPIDVAADLKAPVLGLYGGKDRGIPTDTVMGMVDAIKKAKGSAEIVIYPDAPHGFHADYRGSYRPDDAKDGWKRLQAWFKKNGAA